MGTKPGARVTAFKCVDAANIYIYGYGVYDGDFEPPTFLGFTKEMWEIKFGEPAGEFPPNPRITLDNGKIVWGCECYWGAVGFEARWMPRTIVEVDIDADRLVGEELPAQEAT